jgi:hypothetical protein
MNSSLLNHLSPEPDLGIWFAIRIEPRVYDYIVRIPKELSTDGWKL